MKWVLVVFLILSASVICLAQTQTCTTPEVYSDPGQTVNVTKNLVFVFLDFPNGRINGLPPTQDSQLDLFNSTDLNAVGGMGWVNININDPHDPSSPKRKVVRKYTYDDYWDMYFSVGTYKDAGSYHPHPDYPSHGIMVYGSMIDLLRRSNIWQRGYRSLSNTKQRG